MGRKKQKFLIPQTFIMSDFQNIILTLEDGISIITINRPDKMNALNIQTIAEIKIAVENNIKDSNVYGMIITGEGEKAFAAGADIAEFSNFDVQQATQMSQNGHDAFNTIEQSPKPIIAAINGFALGGGCELAMACHMRIASNQARFGQPEVNLGLLPGYGGTQRLTRLAGRTKATEFLLTGKMITASQAENLGLVNHVTDPENLISKCVEILKLINEKSPEAVKNILKCINAFDDKNINGYELEINEFGKSFATEDFKIGVNAFLNKEKPQFKRN